MRAWLTLTAVCLSIYLGWAMPASAQQSRSAGVPYAPPTVTKGEGTIPSGYAWAGTWLTNSFFGGYVGAMKMVNPNDTLWSDGFVVRGDALIGRYKFNSAGSNDVHVNMYSGDLMLGYRKQIADGMASVAVGPSFETHDNPDPSSGLHGTEVGVKLLADYLTMVNQNTELYAQGTYATPFSVYSLAGRALFKVSDKVWIGPQATLYGNDDPYDEGTIGPFVKIKTDFGEVGFAGGYRHPFTSGNADGYFATAFVGVPF